MGKSSPSPPPAPAIQAGQQQQFNQEDYRFQTRANNPNIVGPMGTIRYTGEPGTTDYTQTTALTQPLQSAIGAQQDVVADRSNIARDLTGRVRSDLSSPLDYSQAQDYGQLGDYDTRRQAAEDAAYRSSERRLDFQFDQQRENLENQLASQGLMQGDEAYDDAMRNFGMTQTDAYGQARDDALRQGRDESQLAYQQQMGTADYQNQLRNQQIQENLQRRGWSINEINSLLSGTSVGLPSAGNYNPQGGMGRTDLLGANQLSYQANLDAFNAKQQQRQGLFGGFSDIAGMFI
tara:strand:+ start:11390 stop:12262 length:873 start_codon:yes stop_codon:yes gene_type:complete